MTMIGQLLSSYRFFFAQGIPLIELLFMLRMKRRSPFALRAMIGLLAYVCVSVLMPNSSLSILFTTLPIFLVSVLAMWLMFQASFWTVAVLCTQAHLIQILSVNVFKLIVIFTNREYFQSVFLHYMTLFAIAICAAWVLMRRRRMDQLLMSANNRGLMNQVFLGMLIIILDSAFNQSQLDFDVLCRFIIIVSVLFALNLQYAVLKWNQAETEKNVIEQLFAAEKTQFRHTMESVAEFNRICHDLKYYVRLIRSNDGRISTSLADQMERTAAAYDHLAKTGNEVIDAVLTEKSLLCKKQDISFTYLVDGPAAAFIDQADLYVLLENALDNAIEAAENVEKGKRFIAVRINRRNDMLAIHIENSCQQPPQFINQLPQTTKADKEKHGYGVKSIQHVAEQYGGYAGFGYSDEIFCLNILLPVS